MVPLNAKCDLVNIHSVVSCDSELLQSSYFRISIDETTNCKLSSDIYTC